MHIKELHDRHLELLLEIHRICTDNHIVYSLSAGSAIGAVREHGFIPWDDDVDIMILRDDYPSFTKAMRENLDNRYSLVEPTERDGAFYDFVTRIIDMSAPLNQSKPYDSVYQYVNNRLAIDVFVFDYFPNKTSVRITSLINKVIYGLAISKRAHRSNQEHTLFERISIAFLSTIGKLLPYSFILKMWRNNATRYNDKAEHKYLYCASLPLHTRYQKAIPVADFEDTLLMEFEGHMLPVIIGYDDYLKRIYGDYWSPPESVHDYNLHTDSRQLVELLEERKLINLKR